MRRAKKKDTVRVHYKLTLDNGTVADDSSAGDPLEFVLGGKEVISGFQDALIGMGVGENKSVKVSPQHAYGPINKNLIITVKRLQLPKDIEISEGLHLQMGQPDGRLLNVLVKEFDDENVTLDGNHPFAGESLNFDIELVEIVNPES